MRNPKLLISLGSVAAAGAVALVLGLAPARAPAARGPDAWTSAVLADPRGALASLADPVRDAVTASAHAEACPCACKMDLLTCVESDRGCPVRPDNGSRLGQIIAAAEAGRSPPAVRTASGQPLPSVDDLRVRLAISVGEARKYYDAGEAVFLDARKPAAYVAGHIRGALNLSPMDFDARDAGLRARIAAAKVVITYCPRGCSMGAFLAQKLLAAGTSNVRVLEGGWDAWRDQGQPVAGHDVQ